MDTDKQPKRPRGRPRKSKPDGLEQVKRPRGRPALGDKSKSITITIRVTQRDYGILKQSAKEKGLTLRDFVLEPHKRLLQRESYGEGNEL